MEKEINEEILETFEKLQFGNVNKPIIIYNDRLKKYIVRLTSLSEHNPHIIYSTAVDAHKDIINIPSKQIFSNTSLEKCLEVIINIFNNIKIDTTPEENLESDLGISWLIKTNDDLIFEIYRIINLMTSVEILNSYKKKIKFSELTKYLNQLIILLVKNVFPTGKTINKSLYNDKILDAIINFQILYEKGEYYLWL